MSTSDNATPASKRGFFSGLAEKLTRTGKGLGSRIAQLIGNAEKPDPALLDHLEELLITSDAGVETSEAILRELRTKLAGGTAGQAGVAPALRDILRDRLALCEQPLTLPSSARPWVLFVVGVNGAGKTTTIGKLAAQFRQDGRSVMLAACDTFRAAAVEQLETWATRTGAQFFSAGCGVQGADAAAVAHDALQTAIARKLDVLIVDTAGRLHTQSGLMDELKKVRRVIERILPGAPHEVLLVLDASIGQNALNQLRQFHEAVGVTGLVLTKLDGTAKGGVIFALAERHAVPIRYIGVGEAIEDLRPFRAAEFAAAIVP